MLAGVIGAKAAFKPASWHHQFKVGLGLDLAGGTTVTLKAVTPKGQLPTAAQMTTAGQIMLARVNAIGTTGAEVQPEGQNLINVTVPGRGSQQVVDQVGTTALMEFRQVLLVATGFPTAVPTTTPSPSPSPSTSPSPAATATPGGKAKGSPKSSASPSASASPAGKSSSGGQSQSVSARSLAGADSAAAKPKPKATPSPTPSPSPSATAPSEKTGLPTTADAAGNVQLVNKPTRLLFDKLNCHDKNWQQAIYHDNSNLWDAQGNQIVSCDSSGNKYVLDVAKVVGTELSSVSAGLDTTNNQNVINFGLKSAGAKAFAQLTSTMYSKYFTSATTNNPLDDFAIVLDGKVVSAPQVTSPITTGSGMITGGGTSGFTQAQATELANQLKYGQLPLTFHVLQTVSVSPQLGSAQLSAGLIAGAIGLLLVVIYSFIYYRGLGIVSVSSLAIAATIGYLSIVLLSRYQALTLSLASIAGLIVAIGITADSFVVFFERLRDEVREGKSLRAAVEGGWRRARRTILVSDTVSFLAAALLYEFAIGDVKGFAYTLGLTTLVDIVVVFLFTKPMITLLARTKFYGRGHRLSGLDPGRLGARSPWHGSRRPAARPATGTAAVAKPETQARITPKEA
jgi:preprotein translocase subunit SecD